MLIIGRFTENTQTYTKNKYNMHHETSCFNLLLTSYASGKPAKLCKHVFILIYLI